MKKQKAKSKKQTKVRPKSKPKAKTKAKIKPKAKMKAKPKHGASSKHKTLHKPKAKSKPVSKHPVRAKPSSPRPAKKSGYMGSVDSIVFDITALKVQGAKDVALAGIKCMKLVATESQASKTEDFVEELRKVGEKVSAARSTEPALRNCVNAILKKVDRYELRRIQNIKKYAAMTCDKLIKDIEAMVTKIAAIGAGMISEGDTILTHCHSGHVIAILKEARLQKKNFRVIVTETQPLKQGLQTAKELLEVKIPVTYCTDSASGVAMKRADKVLIGCDAILADGSVINKIGSLPIAIVAQKYNKPLFVAGESIKFDPLTVAGVQEPIEQRGPAEILGSNELKGAEIMNPAFDTIPAELVTALITEIGVMKPEILRKELGI